MSRVYVDSEYEPLLNSEARERAVRTARKKRILLFVGLVGVVAVLAVAITVPIHVTRKKQSTLNDGLGDPAVEEVVLFETSWYNEPHTCHRPPIPLQYNVREMYGLWYEVAKIQSPGAAVFQEGCKCSKMVFDAPASTNQTLMSMECLDKRFAGFESGAVATMQERERRGSWKQTLYGLETNWYVILQQDTYMLTYDCALSYDNKVEYEIHLYSRTRHLDPSIFSTKLDNLFQIYGGFLNPQKISPVMIEQENCDSDHLNFEEQVELKADEFPRLGVDLLYSHPSKDWVLDLETETTVDSTKQTGTVEQYSFPNGKTFKSQPP